VTFNTPAGPIPVLRDLHLAIRDGERLAILGASGSGKSTLLFVLGLLMRPTAGAYRIRGRDVLGAGDDEQARWRREFVGFVFQSCNLIEGSTVYENLEYPLIYAGVPRPERAPRIEAALASVQLAHRMHHRTNLLSGGEQQRVAVARALVNRPSLVLADEPTGQLDRPTGDIVFNHMEQSLTGTNAALVVVTHDSRVAARCSRVLHLENGTFKES